MAINTITALLSAQKLLIVDQYNNTIMLVYSDMNTVVT